MPCERDDSATTKSKRRRWAQWVDWWALIISTQYSVMYCGRFPEPAALGTVINKRSLLLLASDRCKPLRSASVHLQGAPKVGLQWSGPRANNGGPVPEPIRLPNSDKRYASANNAGLGEACGQWGRPFLVHYTSFLSCHQSQPDQNGRGSNSTGNGSCTFRTEENAAKSL